MGGEEGATDGGFVYLVGMQSASSHSTRQLLTGMCDLSTGAVRNTKVENEGGAGGGG